MRARERAGPASSAFRPLARGRLLLGLLPQPVAGVDRDLDSAIPRPSLFALVARDRLRLAPSAGLDARVHAGGLQVTGRRFRPPDREVLVVLLGPDRVRV